MQARLARPIQDALFLFHKNVGLLVWLLVVLRLFYRVTHPPQPLPVEVPAWQRRAAGLSHAVLYFLIFAMPIAGYVRVRAGGFPIESLDALGVPSLVGKSKTLETAAKTLHFYGAWILIGFITLHVSAALHHGIIRRDGVLGRMWPPLGRQSAGGRRT